MLCASSADVVALQMAWDATIKIGCALSSECFELFIVCHYYPASERRKVIDNCYELCNSYTAILVLLFYLKRSTVSAADVKCSSQLHTAMLFIRAFSCASGEENFATSSVKVVGAAFGASASSALLVAEERSIGDTNYSEFENTLTSFAVRFRGNIHNVHIYTLGSPCQRDADCKYYERSYCNFPEGLCGSHEPPVTTTPAVTTTSAVTPTPAQNGAANYMHKWLGLFRGEMTRAGLFTETAYFGVISCLLAII
ncbi:unnamed protein product [Toxocara canis]|uniref:GPI-anchored surface protein n=1 Tax=Toxocara canis TaxID=6265 RepID=A0A183UKN2_TOXCA|nr:unnamed protein product [Toxocara canis]